MKFAAAAHRDAVGAALGGYPGAPELLLRARLWVAGGPLDFALADVAAAPPATREALLALLLAAADADPEAAAARWLTRYGAGPLAATHGRLAAMRQTAPAPWARAVLDAIAATGTMARAGELLGVSMRTMYRWREEALEIGGAREAVDDVG